MDVFNSSYFEPPRAKDFLLTRLPESMESRREFVFAFDGLNGSTICSDA